MEQLQLKNKLSKEVFAAWNLNDIQIDELLHPSSKKLTDAPIAEVAEFFTEAQRLMICGDFDADGVTSTSIAAIIAKTLNIEFGYYIPDRIKDGYGTSVSTVELAIEKGNTHLLMVDNGVKAQDAIAKAKEAGLKIAIVDHHNITETIKVDAFLHPDLLQDYGKAMSAAGLMALVAEYLEIDDVQIGILAAVGTIADVMPLWHKNRELVIKGIKLLNENRIAQWDLLAGRTRFTTYTSGLLAFQVIPKINSVGRLSDYANMNTMVQFFLSDDPSMIKNYVEQMLKINKLRQDITADMSQTALKLVNDDDLIHVISHRDFHEGVLGIVANRILQETGRPAIIMKEMDDIYKGSSRSASISLAKLYDSLDDKFFKALGGHDFAYGLSVHTEYFAEFNQELQNVIKEMDDLESLDLTLDVEINDITKEAMIELQSFEPFGEGFKLPLMRLELPELYTIAPIKDIGFKITFQNCSLDEAVVFGKGITLDDLQQAKGIVGTPSYNSFKKVSLMIDKVF